MIICNNVFIHDVLFQERNTYFRPFTVIGICYVMDCCVFSSQLGLLLRLVRPVDRVAQTQCTRHEHGM